MQNSRIVCIWKLDRKNSQECHKIVWSGGIKPPNWANKVYCRVSLPKETHEKATCACADSDLFLATELKNDYACVTSDPVGKAVGAKISTWATHFRWKTIESLDFAVKFRSVFRYETVVFRRYVLALLLVVLLWKFEAYLVYIGLIWAEFPRRLCFQKFRHFRYMFPGFPAQISDMRNRFSALSFLAIFS